MPFCDKICKFCPFNKRIRRDTEVARFVSALQGEIRLLAQLHAGKPLRFVYFGGGSPSVLSADQLSCILSSLSSHFGLMHDVEITTEIHPTHATYDALRAFRDVGVTRISLGIQSFSDRLLRELGASHNERNSHEAVQAALATFGHVAIDLLYCFTGQTLEDWLRDLAQAMEEYAIGHLSCYALVPVNSDRLQPSQVEEIRLAEAAISAGENRGLFHYASCASGGFDLALPGERCRYEEEHWGAPQAEFCGLGPGAFGFCADHTTVNRLSVHEYCTCLEGGRLPLAALGTVSPEELRRRYFALGVKTLEVPFGPYRTRFISDPRDDFGPIFEELEAMDLVQVGRDGLVLTDIGRHFVDSCSSAFFSSTERIVPHPEEPEVRSLERQLDPVGTVR